MVISVCDQNADRGPSNEVPVIAKLGTIDEALDYVQRINQGKTITHERPPFGPGLLVYVDRDYAYYVGPMEDV